METKKSHDLSASWKTKKAGGVIQSKFWRPENLGADGVGPSLSLKAQEPGVLMSEYKKRWMFQLKRRSNSPYLCLSVLFWLSMDWIVPTCIGRVTFFTQSTSNANLFLWHVHRHTQK